MSEANLNPCPACDGPASLHHHANRVVCDDIKCLLVGPVDDHTGHKWNALPRRGIAPVGMTDGELIARAILDVSPHSGVSDGVIAELARRETLRSKP